MQVEGRLEITDAVTTAAFAGPGTSILLCAAATQTSRDTNSLIGRTVFS